MNVPASVAATVYRMSSSVCKGLLSKKSTSAHRESRSSFHSEGGRGTTGAGAGGAACCEKQKEDSKTKLDQRVGDKYHEMDDEWVR